MVRIQTPPEFDPRTGDIVAGKPYGFDTADRGGPVDDLLSVVTSKKLNEPCGRFTLNFVPREPVAGYTWADLIPSYSLVEIWAQHYPFDREPVLLMLGLTRGTLISETYTQETPQRSVQVHGSEVSVVFVDQRFLTLPHPPESTRIGKVSGLSGLPSLFSDSVALLGMLAIDPDLATIGDSPVAAIDKFFRMVTGGYESRHNRNGVPLLNLELPSVIDRDDGQPRQTALRDILIFDREKAAARLFDARARLPASSNLITDGASLWSLMGPWVDPSYQELFVRSVDLRRTPALGRTSGVACELLFRRKPFGGRIDDNGTIVGTRADTGSQFDAEFAADPTENVVIDDEIVPQVASRSLSRSAEAISNLYWVEPVFPSGGTPDEFRSLFAPLIDDGTSAPSSIRRFGLRMKKVRDYYFQSPGSSTSIEIAEQRARLLWHWHRFEPLFLRGRYNIAGNPHVDVGKRLTHFGRGISHEFYVTGCTHSIACGQRDGAFYTSVDVERGWPIQKR